MGAFMSERFNVVYFLGAGFSCAWDLPVMNEFFEYARFSDRLSRDDITFLDDLRKTARQAVSMLELRHNNMEDILSLCEMAKKLSDDSACGTDESPGKRFRRIVGRIYSRFGDDAFLEDHPLMKKAREMLGLKPAAASPLPDDASLTIVTTNYDVIPEAICYRAHNPARIPLAYMSLSNRQKNRDLYEPERTENPLLCKLHGSVNWFRQEDVPASSLSGSDPDSNLNLLIEDRVNNARVNRKSQKPCPIPYACDQQHALPGAPLIVAPTLFKLQADVRLQSIWNAARDTL